MHTARIVSQPDHYAYNSIGKYYDTLFYTILPDFLPALDFKQTIKPLFAQENK